jgi:hypothetical protein
MRHLHLHHLHDEEHIALGNDITRLDKHFPDIAGRLRSDFSRHAFTLLSKVFWFFFSKKNRFLP